MTQTSWTPIDVTQNRVEPPGEANNGDLYQHIGGVGFFAGDDFYDPDTHDVIHNPYHPEKPGMSKLASR